MEFDNDTLEKQFQKLPEEIQQALSSPDIADSVREIGGRHGLHVDQESILFDLVGFVMLGLVPSKDFVSTFTKEANVEEGIAKSVAEDINKEILSQVRSSMQKMEANTMGPKSALENAGGFEIEHDMPVDEEESLKGANTRGFSAFSSGDKADMLSSIENPMPTAARIEPKPAASFSVPAAPKNPMTEPLVDQLLAGAAAAPAAQPQGKIDHAPLQKPPASVPQPPRNLPTDDPYKEAVK